jgi:hypothetical protein
VTRKNRAEGVYSAALSALRRNGRPAAIKTLPTIHAAGIDTDCEIHPSVGCPTAYPASSNM